MLATRRVALSVAATIVLTAASAAQTTVDAVGPRVGAAVPAFAGVDQFGRTQTLQTVIGPEGAMIVFYRSAEW